MKDIFADIEAAAQKDEESKTIDLGPISRLVDRQAMLEAPASEFRAKRLYEMAASMDASTEDLEEALKLRKKDLYNIRQIQIPEIMKGFGLKSLQTASGTKIEVKGDISVSVRDEQGFFKYLRDRNYGDIIKDTVVITIDNDESRKEVTKLLDEIDCLFERKEAIHSATLKKHIKDGLKEGRRPPDELVNIHEYEYSKIKK